MKAAALKRLHARVVLLSWAALGYVFRSGKKPDRPKAILVVSRFLLGDTLMLAPLLAALRFHHPAARIVVAVQSGFLPLFSLRPYGVEAMAFDIDDLASLCRLRAGGPFDLAVVPGDNRNAVAARAFRSSWIAAIDGDRPQWKNNICDELIPLSDQVGTIYDALADLAGPSVDLRYLQGSWTVAEAPRGHPDLSNTPYVILHVGSSSPSRRWAAELWQVVAERLSRHGYQVIWSAGPGEETIVREIDPAGNYSDTAGRLDLRQLWHFVKGAALMISADTGVVHMAKLNGCPTVCLYGPGGEALVGKGRYFSQARIRGVVVPHFRDRRDGCVFRRRMPWAEAWAGPDPNETWPTTEQQLQAVLDAASDLLGASLNPAT